MIEDKFKDLQIHPDFFTEDPKIIKRECNGCGPSGWLSLLIPDKILDIDISHICDLHDYEYYKGSTAEEKIKADINFLYNLLTYLSKNINIQKEKRRWFKARKIAIKYYEAVDRFGFMAFIFAVNKTLDKISIKNNIEQLLRVECDRYEEWDNSLDPIKIPKVGNFLENEEDDIL